MPTRITWPKVGDVVQVVFDDHVENEKEVVECEVFGRVMKIDKREMRVAAWLPTDPQFHDVDNGKTEYGIVRKAVLRIKKLSGLKP